MDPNVISPQNPEPNPPTPETAGGVDLSDEAYAKLSKIVKNEVTSLLSHPGDAHDGLKLTFLSALLEAGVLTKDNLSEQIVGKLDSWARDRAYEADREALKHQPPGA
jgi:hypothetical protein